MRVDHEIRFDQAEQKDSGMCSSPLLSLDYVIDDAYSYLLKQKLIGSQATESETTNFFAY